MGRTSILRDHEGADDARFDAAVTAAASVFGEPRRREIYLHVRSSPGASVSDVAGAFSLHPNVVRHHLERLVDAGYLQVELESPRPGGGRPARCYRAPDDHPLADLLSRRDELLVLLLVEALRLLGPEDAERMAEKVGFEHGRSLAARMAPDRSGRSVRSAMHAIAATFTAYGFAARAEDLESTTAVVAEQCPFGHAASSNPVLCAVDRGMVQGLLAGLCGTDTAPVAVVVSSRARGDAACGAIA